VVVVGVFVVGVFRPAPRAAAAAARRPTRHAVKLLPGFNSRKGSAFFPFFPFPPPFPFPPLFLSSLPLFPFSLFSLFSLFPSFFPAPLLPLFPLSYIF
jgi:hypothetical protein